MRIYEELFIVKPDTAEEDIDGVIEQVSGIVKNAGGTVEKTDKWGVRKLAYRVEKRSEGFYVLMQFTSEASTVHEVERRLRVSDHVLKFITVRIDEKLKRIDKRRKQREKRAARRPAPAAAAPAFPASEPAPQPAMPGAPVAAGEPAKEKA